MPTMLYGHRYAQASSTVRISPTICKLKSKREEGTPTPEGQAFG